MEEVRAPFNPYSAPEAVLSQPEVVEAGAPASRWKRLGANILDNLALLMAIMLPIVLIDGLGGLEDDRTSGVAGLLAFAGMVAVLVIDLVLLHRHGQTIGKRVCGIRIVRSDGQRTGLGRLFGLRYLLAQGVLGLVPFFSLIDILFIFGQERRCLHDLIADTIVVDA